MKDIIAKKSLGFYFIIIAIVLGLIGLIRYLIWAPAHNAVDGLIIASLILGIILGVVLGIRDNEYVVVLSTACYSVAAIRLLTNSVGSFVDAFQGINMFGDSTQVGTILSISITILISVLISIISSFLQRVRE